MVRLRDIPRTATFAWSPGAGSPLVVTGTRAGAVDADFSDESKLELWDLSLDDQEQGLELQPIASIATDARFYDIAWSPPDADHPKGIIAGAMENGSLDLWDAAKLQASGTDALISQTTKHTGAIKTLQFNPLKPQILATAGAKGEIYIYDVNDIANPFRLGNAAARSDDIGCLAWNRKVSHILATGGAGGFVTVWDLKTKKASLTLNNSRKAVSAIAWDPNNSTKLLTGTPDDNNPVILLWDLRNSNAPERTLLGHEQGILSLSWCPQDSSILLSSGKDNKTMVWNPLTGERYGELPEVTNWTFQTRFNPHNPNLSATASFDGKITIQTLQNTNPDTSKNAIDNNLDGADFFSAAQTQPQGASWSLSKAPQWFERPIGASFGFGGKIVIFKPSPGHERSSKVIISQFSADSDFSSANEKFQEALASGDLSSICEERMEQSKTEEEKADWKVMQTLIGENPRGKIVEYLDLKEELSEEPASKEAKAEGVETDEKKLSNFFDGADGDGDDDEFLSGVAATKGAKTDNPFHLFADNDTTVERHITKALMLGDFAKATDICLREDRIADAFLIANCGGQELVDKVQAAYLSRKTGSPSYIRLLGSVIEKNLWDVVYNADLQNWKETMAIICTFSDPTEFSDLCEALGDRIHESGERQDASFCYLVGSKLEKVVPIWTAELEEAEQAGTRDPSQDSTFSVHARTLQNFIEKVTVFRQVSKFVDNETNESAGWKLAALYDKYTEYADILAGHGQLDAAQRYLDLLPSTYPAAEGARSRVKQATQKTTKAAAKIATRTSSAKPQTQSSYGYPTPQPQPLGNPGAANLYSNVNSISTSQPYQPLQPQQSQQPQQPSYGGNPYQPSGMYQPPAQSYTSPALPPVSGPPRSGTPTISTMHSAPKDSWNDVPIVTKAAPPRRSTPSAPPPVGPYGVQTSQTPPGPPAYGAPPKASPPPPPPKGSAPPRVTSPLAGLPQTFQAPPRPSSAANQYAPPPPQVGASPQLANLVTRTASPYNAPPAGAPPSNRYAPAPAAQQPSPGPPVGGYMPPPPAGSNAPPANPYSQFAQPPAAPPAASPYAPTNNYGSSHGAGAPLSTSGPPTGPPPMGRPGPPPAGATPTPPPPRAAAAPSPKGKHPPGDRSHIPASAQRLVEILTEDMQRVAAKAPATFAPQVKDTQKRLNLLFDHLNNDELVSPYSVSKLSEVADALKSKDHATAAKLQAELQRERVEECGQWMVGLKRLINMSKATP
ncbi:hypothetical protein V2A60_006621 [Cordyceps javanica]|uniref:Protein transport protein SEC31 n=1 Tax=Cordyceps javanica TaxID=43265 RepID=A0A545W5A8_9HYPO|nr:protein transport protein (SEC31) [Cordyceps javanica]TQW09183.1 protein transport protein (SEC31) [Cordyceps javanica]